MTKTKCVYQVGDRVAERPKTHGIYTNNPQVKQRIIQYRDQRYGTVIDVTSKQNKLGRKEKYIVVKWDHNDRISEHAQARLCHLKDFDRIMNETCSIIGD